MEQKTQIIEGRVVSIQRNTFFVKSGKEEYAAHLTGKLRESEEIPVVGDYVNVCLDGYGSASIIKLQPRKSLFVRPDRSGHVDGYVKTMKEQPVIANFDYVFIITSLNFNFNLNRIARYAAITTSGGGTPVVVLTKADLVNDADSYIEKVKTLNRKMEIYAVSSFTGEELEQLRK